jgi:adenylylsulfate kinase
MLKTTIWITGLPCSGKTTIAKRLEGELLNRGYRVAHLDGDDVRQKLNSDLGFSPEDRRENLRRIAHVAQLFNEKGNFVIASFVSPTNEYRRMIRSIIENMKLVYLKCSIEECERRDTKEMYQKARTGEIKEFTGISAPFEEPENPDLVLDTEKLDPEECVKRILVLIENEEH